MMEWLLSWEGIGQVLGTAAGLVYVWLEIKHKPAMWVLGIVMALCYVAVFAVEHLYASMALYVYYLVISIYGWIKWKPSNATEAVSLAVRHISRVEALVAFLGGAAVFVAAWLLMKRFTDNPYPMADAAVTSLNVVATWLLTRSILEQWLLLIGANILAVVLYAVSGLYATTVLFAVYVAASIIGYRQWRIRVE